MKVKIDLKANIKSLTQCFEAISTIYFTKPSKVFKWNEFIKDPPHPSTVHFCYGFLIHSVSDVKDDRMLVNCKCWMYILFRNDFRIMASPNPGTCTFAPNRRWCKPCLRSNNAFRLYNNLPEKRNKICY